MQKTQFFLNLIVSIWLKTIIYNNLKQITSKFLAIFSLYLTDAVRDLAHGFSILARRLIKTSKSKCDKHHFMLFYTQLLINKVLFGYPLLTGKNHANERCLSRD